MAPQSYFATFWQVRNCRSMVAHSNFSDWRATVLQPPFASWSSKKKAFAWPQNGEGLKMILLLLSYTNYMQVNTWNILRLRIISRLTVNDYCGIMFIRRGQRSWVANIFQVLGDVILLVMCVYMYVRRFKFVGKGYSRKPRKCPPPNNDDS